APPPARSPRARPRPPPPPATLGGAVAPDTGATAEATGRVRLDERDHGAVTDDRRRTDGAFAAAGALERAGHVLGARHKPDQSSTILGLVPSRVGLRHGHLLFTCAPRPEREGRAESPTERHTRPFHAQQRQYRQHEHDDRAAGHGHASAAQPDPHAPATPSKTAAFTPRRASSARNGTGSTSDPRPGTPADGPLRRASPGAAPARRAAVSASTVPAASAVRSITP